MTKKHDRRFESELAEREAIYRRLRDMALGANQGYSITGGLDDEDEGYKPEYDDDNPNGYIEPLTAHMGLEGFGRWLAAVYVEFDLPYVRDSVVFGNPGDDPPEKENKEEAEERKMRQLTNRRIRLEYMRELHKFENLTKATNTLYEMGKRA